MNSLSRSLNHKSFFIDIEDKNNDNTIIEKFEPINIRDDFEYAFKMFSKALDVILTKKEADPYISDFQYLSKKYTVYSRNTAYVDSGFVTVLLALEAA